MELLVISVESLLCDLTEGIKRVSLGKDTLDESALEDVLSIALELQKFDKIVKFSRDNSYYEVLLPLLLLWIEK